MFVLDRQFHAVCRMAWCALVAKLANSFELSYFLSCYFATKSHVVADGVVPQEKYLFVVVKHIEFFNCFVEFGGVEFESFYWVKFVVAYFQCAVVPFLYYNVVFQ